MPIDPRSALGGFAARPFDRRSVLKLGAVLGGTAMLAACSGPSVGGDTAATAAPDTDWDGIQPATDITWWTTHPGQTSDLEAQFAADFLAKTGITVNVVTGGASYDEIAQKLQAAAGTDSMPDMVNASDTWWFRYMVNKQSIAMDGLMSHLGFEVDDFNKVFLDDYLYNGARYAVPYARSTPIFYYDKSIWQKAGLPDRAPDTWAELEEWAPAIMKVTGGNPAVRLPQGSIGTWAMSNVLWGRGGQYSDGWDLKLDQPETLEAAGYARGLVFDSKIANVAAASGDTAVDFAGGLAPCTIASAGAVGIVTASAKFPIGTGVLPGGPQGQFVPTGGTGLAVIGSKTKEQQLAAAMFIKHLTEVDQQVAMAKKTGYAPSRTSAGESTDLTGFWASNPAFRTVYDSLEHVRSQDWARTLIPNGDTYLQQPWSQILTQDADPAAVFPAAATQLTSAYTENVQPYL